MMPNNSVFNRFSGGGDITVTMPDVSEFPTCGFPSPARDYMTTAIDLNRVLISNRPTTFLARAHGNSMRRMGIADGDLVVIDRSVAPRNGDVVVAHIDGDFTLVVADSKQMCAGAWGVVIHAIHSFTGR